VTVYNRQQQVNSYGTPRIAN